MGNLCLRKKPKEHEPVQDEEENQLEYANQKQAVPLPISHQEQKTSSMSKDKLHHQMVEENNSSEGLLYDTPTLGQDDVADFALQQKYQQDPNLIASQISQVSGSSQQFKEQKSKEQVEIEIKFEKKNQEFETPTVNSQILKSDLLAFNAQEQNQAANLQKDQGIKDLNQECDQINWDKDQALTTPNQMPNSQVQQPQLQKLNEVVSQQVDWANPATNQQSKDNIILANQQATAVKQDKLEQTIDPSFRFVEEKGKEQAQQATQDEFDREQKQLLLIEQKNIQHKQEIIQAKVEELLVQTTKLQQVTAQQLLETEQQKVLEQQELQQEKPILKSNEQKVEQQKVEQQEIQQIEVKQHELQQQEAEQQIIDQIQQEQQEIDQQDLEQFKVEQQVIEQQLIEQQVCEERINEQQVIEQVIDQQLLKQSETPAYNQEQQEILESNDLLNTQFLSQDIEPQNEEIQIEQKEEAQVMKDTQEQIQYDQQSEQQVQAQQVQVEVEGQQVEVTAVQSNQEQNKESFIDQDQEEVQQQQLPNSEKQVEQLEQVEQVVQQEQVEQQEQEEYEQEQKQKQQQQQQQQEVEVEEQQEQVQQEQQGQTNVEENQEQEQVEYEQEQEQEQQQVEVEEQQQEQQEEIIKAENEIEQQQQKQDQQNIEQDTNQNQTVFQWKYEGNEIKVTGNWLNWNEKLVLEDNDGIKQLILSLEKGIYLFKFIVDGEWKTSQDYEIDQESQNNKIVIE